VNRSKLKVFTVPRAEFDYAKKVWVPKKYLLPELNGDYVLLTPRELLTKNDTWINKHELYRDFETLPAAATDASLRQQLVSYFNAKVAEYSEVKKNEKTGKDERHLSAKGRKSAIDDTISAYPAVIDIYVHKKEQRGDTAVEQSEVRVNETESFHESQWADFVTKVGTSHKRPTRTS
jgi:hypothetical protein